MFTINPDKIMTFPHFSVLEIILLLIPIVISMIVFRGSVYGSFNAGIIPGIFIVRIVSGAAFILCACFFHRSVPFTLKYNNGVDTEAAWLAVFILAALAVFASRVNAKTNSNLETYPQLRTNDWNSSLIVGNTITWVIYLFGYEYFFRGALLFGYDDNVSFAVIITLNVLLYAGAHACKGSKECFLSIPFGALLCCLCLATNSFYPGFIIHTVLALSNDFYSILYTRRTNNNREVQSFVLITGASAGIGKALAVEFAMRGKNLLLVSLPNTGLEKLANELTNRYKIIADWYCADLTEPKAPSEILSWCKHNSFLVDTLVNNAGFGNLNSFEKTNAEVLNNMMLLNNSSVVKLTHEFIPELKKFKQSYLLNVGSLASFMPIPNKSLYAATKSFVYSFSQSLFYELRHLNIHVSCLCPGGTLTERIRIDLAKQELKHVNFCQSPEEVAKYAVDKMYTKQFRIIPGWHNRTLFRLSQLLPEFIKIQIIEIAFKTRPAKSIRGRLSVSPVTSIALMTR
jgi:uncharacterized protein